ncbi:hypothetical protein VE01_03253 [Pseudogymnoascus verrucosus]|uniref:RING-type domain-containing protein n=1 Tax=Pseudogymnoascus verrucosus TaxID=342668 RepID=A0A1B8GSK3_9PEZI|nr:uncharacterized protein VE01_03253 [Pseudogymnoascus verrucosus]OBT98801.1 hypothetical protein VE01_03253 [Pseudogymnoascus verrucosus]
MTESQRSHNKRTFGEMSSSISMARRPSADPSPSFPGSTFTFPTPPPPQTQTHSQGQRRTPHPHNPPRSSPFSVMLDPRHPPSRPSLDRQPTVIDLTDDHHERAPSQSRRSSQRSTLPPQLERSDYTTLGDVISIESDDDDDEVEIVSSRALPSRRPSAPPSRLRLPRPPRSPRQHAGHPWPHLPSMLPPMDAPESILDNPSLLFGGLADMFPGSWRNLQGNMERYVLGRQSEIGPIPVHMRGASMRFRTFPLHEHVRQEPRKAEHVPPPPVGEGFTRSPKEDDVIVCPACDEELVVGPEEPAAGTTPSSTGKTAAKAKARSRKDREEHPFWVVRECGHVYCNKCYQSRKPDTKSTSKNLFPEVQSGARKVPLCAVDDCTSEVGDKKFWVGVFM